MNEQMTKESLLQTLREKRAEWDAALAEIPEAHMTEPGAAGIWSVKDIVAHINYYERWMADRMHEELRGESYTPTPMDMMHFEKRNTLIYEQYRDQPLDEVLAESRRGFERIIEAVQAHSEAFLTEPHLFEGAPQPVIIWKMLRSEVYDHYAQHIPSLKVWAAAHSE